MARIVFWGTPKIAADTLESLYRAGHTLVSVICQPDKKQGRGKKLAPQAVSLRARELGLDVFTPANINDADFIEKLRNDEADFFVVIAYGKILSSALLDLPKYACLNVHYSLLPQWRGAAPMQFSLLAGDAKTGVSVILMNQTMDAGDIIYQEEIELDDENIQMLSQKLCVLGQKALVESLNNFKQLPPRPQKHTLATFTRRIINTDRQILWFKSGLEIYRQHLAFAPKPGVYAFFRQKRIIFYSFYWLEDTKNNKTAGEIIEVTKAALFIHTNRGKIVLTYLQPENSKVMNVEAFINGFLPRVGEIFS